MPYLFLPDRRPLHARVQVPVPLVPVATLRLFRRLTDRHFLEVLNQASTYHKLISRFQMPRILCPLLEGIELLVLVLEAPDTDGGTPKLTFHAPPCTRPLKKKCRTPQVQPNLFYRRKAVLQRANRSSLLTLTRLPSIQSRRNRPGTTNVGLLLYESTTPYEMKPRMSWLKVSEPGWILPFPFSLYKVRVCFIVSIFSFTNFCL